MTRARRELVSIDDTPYYHITSRCVRRAFLWGQDHFSGKDYSHRKEWVIERLSLLARVFTIELCAYAVMSNHYHLVLRVDKDKAIQLPDQQVIQRWNKLYQLPVLMQRYLKGECTTQAEHKEVRKLINTWRERLWDISWFMSNMNEYLARAANKEDNCKGRFWEARYSSQALLDEAAVLTCMSYVDLNPIRAAMADTPEASDFTSIQQRIQQWHKTQPGKKKTKSNKKANTTPQPRLMPLAKQHRGSHQNAIGFSLKDYLELVDWAGRHVRGDKRSAIDQAIPPILERLNIDCDAFLEHQQGKHNHHTPRALGHSSKLAQLCIQAEQAFIKGISQSRRLYRFA